MNENNLFDDIARTLASPIPRRQAFGWILRGLAGAALASVFGAGTARAAVRCPPGQFLCGTVCYPNGWMCCDCSTSLGCHPSQVCVGKKSKKKCKCPPGQPLCGTVCCPKGWNCCDSSTSLCCHPSQVCDGKNCKNTPSIIYFQSTGI
jgi:hypothetical protein